VWTSLPLVLALASDPPAGEPAPPKGQAPAPEVQRGAEVSGSRSDTSPPLRDLPPAPRRPGRRVHPVKPLPRPAPPAGEPAPPAPEREPTR